MFWVIIGRDSIQKYNLFSYVPSHSSTVQNKNVDTLASRRTVRFADSCPSLKELRPLEDTCGNCVKAPLTVSSYVQAALVDRADPSTEVPPATSSDEFASMGSFEPWLPSAFPQGDILSEIHISGSPGLQLRITALCQEFWSLFSMIT